MKMKFVVNGKEGQGTPFSGCFQELSLNKKKKKISLVALDGCFWRILFTLCASYILLYTVETGIKFWTFILIDRSQENI